jgi:hypothetical protein
MEQTSYLKYIPTIRREIGQIQSDIGLREKSSFMNVRNPTKKRPYTQLPRDPQNPKEMLEEFDNPSWVPDQD